MDKLKVGILGATGMVGQQYVSLLQSHPWFEVSCVAASHSSSGKKYSESVKGRWHARDEIPGQVKNLVVSDVAGIGEIAKKCDFVFSALESDAAQIFEEKYAENGVPVVSNASTHRNDKDVPMIIPEINHAHTEIIVQQRKNRGWEKGFIAVKPNCSLQSYLTPLHALHKKFGVTKVVVTTMQAVSGAGHPGVASFDIIDNVIPFIGGEEEKTENEPLKILGEIKGNEIMPAKGISISAHCNRVHVIDGHLACVSVAFEKKPSAEQILQAWNSFKSVPQEMNLPFAPKQPIVYREQENRPQPRLDRDAQNDILSR